MLSLVASAYTAAAMDQTLTRNEAKELMQLLDLQMCVWGNIPLMRKKYLLKCKEFHPDKGGDEEKMKRLTELWMKLETNLGRIHKESESEEWTWNTNQVLRYCGHSNCGCTFTMSACTLGDLYGPLFGQAILKEWDKCINKWDPFCTCIMCVLRGRHKKRVKALRRPLIWIRCYCYDCYRRWFGFPVCWETFLYWKMILHETPFGAIHV